MPEPKAAKKSVYERLIAHVFLAGWKPGAKVVEFERSDLEVAAKKLGVPLPKNIGDNIYSFRYRRSLPKEISSKASRGREWVIEGAGRARYRFRLAKVSLIEPSKHLEAIKVPDATPEIIGAYALSDEQALLAKLRYNRLIDVFLGVTAYSLQNHLRTTVAGLGQIEIDEVYVGLSRNGTQFVIPVQAKGGSDRLSSVQSRQDIACCAEKFPGLVCRPVSAQFVDRDLIALFEIAVDGEDVLVREERQYRLVPASEISPEDLRSYSARWEG